MTASNPTPDNATPAPVDQVDDLDLQARKVTVSEKDLPLHCPPTNAPLWKLHPRVYLEIAETGNITCPYCGTYYELAPGVKIPVHPH